MTLTRIACLALLTATSFSAVPAIAQDRGHRTTSGSPPPSDDASSRQAASSSPPPEDDLLRQVAHVDDRFEALLETGCTYEVTIRGTVSPVRDNRNANATTQRLRPDLRVAATVRCPASTESHIQERRVASTGVTREELERLVELNATVHRMQNSGRCLYVPQIAFRADTFASSLVDYLCPRGSSHVRSTGTSHQAH